MPETQLPYSPREHKTFFCCCLTSVCKKIRSFIPPDGRKCFTVPYRPCTTQDSQNKHYFPGENKGSRSTEANEMSALEADTLILSLYVPPLHPPAGLPTPPKLTINLCRLWNSSLPASSLLGDPFAGPVKDSLWRTRFLTLSWDSSCLNWEIYSADTYTWGSPSKIPS